MDHILRCHDIIKTNFVRGEGCYLFDGQGRRYVDLESGTWAATLGHSHPRVNERMRTQIEQVVHLGVSYPNEAAEGAAIAVLDAVGIENGKCVFLSSGSESVEFALRAARISTGKRMFLASADSYLSAYSPATQRTPEEWVSVEWRALRGGEVDEPLRGLPFESVAAFVFEPGGSGSSFVTFPPERPVAELAARVKQEGGLIVVNEVTTGLGRTGAWFGFQHYDLEPDIVALGKGLGNGYPVSAVAVTRPVAEGLEEAGLRYAQSHQNDPLGCSIAQEVIAVLRDENLIERSREVGAYFLDGLKHLQGKHDLVTDARGRGMLLALELDSQATPSARDVGRALFDAGFLVGCSPAGNILRFDPPLTVDTRDIDRLMECLDSVLESAR